MSFDGIVTKAIVEELNNKILNGRIDKLYQPEKDELLLHIHNMKSNYKLLISSSSNNPRIYLTDQKKENPKEAPLFSMILRKHLLGGSILAISQYLLDRIILIDISSRNELGDLSEKTLIVEIMGKHSNIILIDKETNKIIDSIKRVNQDMSRVRQVLPGMIYEFPPITNKINPLNLSKEIFLSRIGDQDGNMKIYKFFYSHFLGISPLLGREVCFLSNIDMDRSINSLSPEDIEFLYQNFNSICLQIDSKEYMPNYILGHDSNILEFHSLDIKQFGNYKKLYKESISDVLNVFYLTRDNVDRISQKSLSIRKSVQAKLERYKNKLGKQKEELLESFERETYKVYADLISSNIHLITKGDQAVDLQNFYDANMAIIQVPLDIKLSPSQNAQKYYKKYSKLKNASHLLVDQIKETEEDILYLESILLDIDQSESVNEIDDIKEELIKSSFIKGSLKKKKKESLSKPHHYKSSDGINIYVGKNNRQNDYLTLKQAHKNDLWLHVQKMPGSHVIIENLSNDVPLSTLKEGALLAAYYSKGKNSTNVPVDYTQRRNVKKPSNAKPGLVIYDTYKTIFVTPNIIEIEKIERLD